MNYKLITLITLFFIFIFCIIFLILLLKIIYSKINLKNLTDTFLTDTLKNKHLLDSNSNIKINTKMWNNNNYNNEFNSKTNNNNKTITNINTNDNDFKYNNANNYTNFNTNSNNKNKFNNKNNNNTNLNTNNNKTNTNNSNINTKTNTNNNTKYWNYSTVLIIFLVKLINILYINSSLFLKLIKILIILKVYLNLFLLILLFNIDLLSYYLYDYTLFFIFLFTILKFKFLILYLIDIFINTIKYYYFNKIKNKLNNSILNIKNINNRLISTNFIINFLLYKIKHLKQLKILKFNDIRKIQIFKLKLKLILKLILKQKLLKFKRLELIKNNLFYLYLIVLNFFRVTNILFFIPDLFYFFNFPFTFVPYLIGLNINFRKYILNNLDSDKITYLEIFNNENFIHLNNSNNNNYTNNNANSYNNNSNNIIYNTESNDNNNNNNYNNNTNFNSNTINNNVNNTNISYNDNYFNFNTLNLEEKYEYLKSKFDSKGMDDNQPLLDWFIRLLNNSDGTKESIDSIIDKNLNSIQLIERNSQLSRYGFARIKPFLIHREDTSSNKMVDSIPYKAPSQFDDD